MERVLVSRQPIYRPNRTEFGYELLFRNGEDDCALFSDGDQATAEVIVNAFMEIGLEEIVGSHLAFINFDRNLILADYWKSLPRERTVVEVLESVHPDEPLLKKLKEMHSQQYFVALDDFVCEAPYLDLLKFAHFVKFDVLSTDDATLERSVAFVKKYPVELIAEKVETQEQFERCKKLRFDYYQGYYFSRPQLVEGHHRPPVNRSSAIGLIIKLNNPEIELKEFERVISQDVSLSYKLLRYINSAVYALRRPVTSIGHAISLLGQEKIRIWASLIVLSGFSERLRDVVVTGSVRARMCEHLARNVNIPKPHRGFLVGLLSVLDTLMEEPLERLIRPLPLEPEILGALLHTKGELGSILRCVIEYERRNWENAKASIALSHTQIGDAYSQSLKWSLKTLNAFAATVSENPGAA